MSGIRITNMRYRLMKFPLIHLLLLYFILLSEKIYFTVKIFNMHTISMGLYQLYAKCMQRRIKFSRTSMVELHCENHKKALLL